jgi:hypothetical protein
MSEKGLPSLLERHWAESALAIGAVIIAAVSLWVAFDSERTNRELVASASWPFVELVSDESAPTAQPRVLRLGIANDGIGPAKLESFEVFWQGKPQRSPWQLLQSCCADGKTAAGESGGIQALRADPDLRSASDQGIVLRAGKTIPLLTYTRSSDNSAIWDAFESQVVNKLSVRYCYCSAFNDCWVISSRLGTRRDLNPPRVRACSPPQVPYDNTSG